MEPYVYHYVSASETVSKQLYMKHLCTIWSETLGCTTEHFPFYSHVWKVWKGESYHLEEVDDQ